MTGAPVQIATRAPFDCSSHFPVKLLDVLLCVWMSKPRCGQQPRRDGRPPARAWMDLVEARRRRRRRRRARAACTTPTDRLLRLPAGLPLCSARVGVLGPCYDMPRAGEITASGDLRQGLLTTDQSTEVPTGGAEASLHQGDPSWLEATFGNTDAWTYGGLWWPLQACHLPRKGLGWWAIMIVLGSLALGLLGLRFGVGIEESSVANDLYDCAALIWLLLFVLFVYDVLEFTDPVVGCPATLLQSVRDAGVSYERCRSCLVIYCRLLACTLRLTVTIAGIIWIVVGLFQGFSGFGLWFAVGCLFAGIVIIPIVGTWVTSLFL